MRKVAALLAAVIVLAAAGPAAAASAPPGIWANPSDSVRVAFRRCGEAICGTVIWANAKAEADARRGGTDRLVGTMLFRDFVEEDAHRWSGEVYIPDIGQSLSGTITQIDARTLVGEGCVFAGFGCKSQTWKRLK
ncbi:MAG: DUF2147 domain-containing protein [Pseudomonadota bacterium]|jgi:uncharacterized protein (DUF2147 family)|uniref:DUF2147 domain-containing protein n=1 Tax=hydrothermal vent metagenome TaxID=652676 RepID=A0A160TJY2_9ZZZZ